MKPKTNLKSAHKISAINEAKGILRGGRSTKDILKMIRKEEKDFEKKKR